MSKILVCFLTTVLVVKITCVPINPNETLSTTTTTEKNSYDLSNFAEVYDQRQNGSENVRVNVDGVVLVWAPPESLLGAAASLADPSNFDNDYAEIEQLLLNQLGQQKPEDLIVVKPEAPSSSTTTSLPTTKLSVDGVVETNSETPVLKRQPGIRRRFRLPEFIRPFVRNAA